MRLTGPSHKRFRSARIAGLQRIYERISGYAMSRRSTFDRPHLSCSLMDPFRRLLCFLGFHDFRVVEATMSFGASGAVEKVECRRCGRRTTRRQRDS